MKASQSLQVLNQDITHPYKISEYPNRGSEKPRRSAQKERSPYDVIAIGKNSKSRRTVLGPEEEALE